MIGIRAAPADSAGIGSERVEASPWNDPRKRVSPAERGRNGIKRRIEEHSLATSAEWIQISSAEIPQRVERPVSAENGNLLAGCLRTSQSELLTRSPEQRVARSWDLGPSAGQRLALSASDASVFQTPSKWMRLSSALSARSAPSSIEK